MTEDAQFNMDALAGASVEVAFLKDIDPLELSKTICAMANSRGGRIYVGAFDEGRSDRRSAEHRVYTPGVNANLVAQVTKNLPKHFDDPLPVLAESNIDVPGQSLPVVKIVVERNSAKDDVALIDRTMWKRKGGRNESTTARARLIRKPDVSRAEQQLDETKSKGSQSPPPASDDVTAETGGTTGGAGSPATSSAPASSTAEPTKEPLPAKDAFILFNESETGVADIVRQLELLEVSTYFFRRDIAFGGEFTDREQQELKAARCVLLFLGEKGWGPTHQQLAKDAKEFGKQIIPVLLAKLPDDALDKADSSFRGLRRVELVPPNRQLIRELAQTIKASRAEARPPGAGSMGREMDMTREASLDHPVLDASEYADVLASLIQSVENNDALSFAILGPWGRGKTFLMRLVATRLAQQSYTTVLFSAWKYRTTPELWSYLYEVLYSHAAKLGWAVPIRTGLLRHGIWPMVPLLLTIAVSLSTISQKVYLAGFVLSLFGVLGVIYLLGVSRSFVKAGQSIKATYWDLPRHQDRLGLQFAIGDDLRALLMGWMPNASGWTAALKTVFVKKPLSTLCYSIAAIAVWWTAREAAIEKASGNWLVGNSVIFFLGIALAVVLLPVLALVRKVDNNDRILLVVDDLDRCHPEQMLEIIECLQLFLDDDEVKRRLKVVMLIEEDILRNALRTKYVDSLNLSENDHGRIDHLVNDNLEKLFLVWLRLEPLRHDEIRTVFQNVCSSLSPIKVVADDSAGDKGEGTEAAPAASDDAVGTTITPASGPEQEPTTIATEDKIDTALSSEEESVIVSMVDQIIYDTNRERWGPRSVRSFVFRYQLARMLLVKLGKNHPTADIVRAIATASDREVTAPGRDMDELLFRVARQVS